MLGDTGKLIEEQTKKEKKKNVTCVRLACAAPDEIVALGLGFHSQAMPLFEIIPVVDFSDREIIYPGMDSLCET